jgi:predicted oxidoreductase
MAMAWVLRVVDKMTPVSETGKQPKIETAYYYTTAKTAVKSFF